MVKSHKSRRSFFTRLWIGLGIVAFLQLVTGAAFFLLSGKKQTRTSKIPPLKAGIITDYPPGSVTLISKGHLYLCRLDDGGFLAISRKCTHLGCAVPWVAERKQFECPCHASIFDLTGNVIKSPAPRALDLFGVSFERNVIMIDINQPIKRTGFTAEQVAYPQERG